VRLVRARWFFAVSVPWEYALRDLYLRFVAGLFAASARLFGRAVVVNGVRNGDIDLSYAGFSWVDRFGMTSINVVTLVALVIATGPVTWKRRAWMVFAGLGLLLFLQIFGLWTDIAHVHLHTRPRFAGFANGLRGFMTGYGTFFFPLVLWLVLVRDHLPLPGRGARAEP
jgi:hypothetical protein